MKLKLEQCLLPSFFSILVLYGLTGAVGCSPYVMSLRGSDIEIPLLIWLCFFVVAMVVGFASYLAVAFGPLSDRSQTYWGRFRDKLMWNFKVIGIPIILIVYVPLLRIVFPMICDGYVYHNH